MCKDICNGMFYYIFWALFYRVKKGESFSLLDDELWVYIDLIIKIQDLYSLIFLNKLVVAKNLAFY
jgi:hypothetical protein